MHQFTLPKWVLPLISFVLLWVFLFCFVFIMKQLGKILFDMGLRESKKNQQ